MPGVFGGYGCCTYPLAKIKGVNVFDYMGEAPDKWAFDFETLMNDQPFPDARYSTHHMGMGFELADEGELYMICQGSGGGYGDVLERDPEAVIADLEADYISHDTAREIYFVVYDQETLAVDVEATTGRARRRADGAQGTRRPVRRVHPRLGDGRAARAAALLRLVGRRQHRHLRDRVVDAADRRGSAARWPSCRRSTCPIPKDLALAGQQARIAELESRLAEFGSAAADRSPAPVS